MNGFRASPHRSTAGSTWFQRWWNDPFSNAKQVESASESAPRSIAAHRPTVLNATLSELGLALAGKQISSVELTELFLQRAQRLNSDFNAFITIDPELTLAEARAADQRIASGRTHALTGIPIALKDIFCAKGWLTTCGSKILSNFTAPYDPHGSRQ